MGWLNSEKPPDKWNPAFFKSFVERLRTAVNYLDNQNFPNGIHGTLLNQKTVPLTALASGEWRIPIIALAQPYTTTSTTEINVGQYVFWSPNIFPSTCNLYLEVTGCSNNAAATATFNLYGVNGVLATVTDNSGQYKWLRSAAFTPPTESQTMVLKMKISNSSYSANILGASLIISL